MQGAGARLDWVNVVLLNLWFNHFVTNDDFDFQLHSRLYMWQWWPQQAACKESGLVANQSTAALLSGNPFGQCTHVVMISELMPSTYQLLPSQAQIWTSQLHLWSGCKTFYNRLLLHQHLEIDFEGTHPLTQNLQLSRTCASSVLGA